MTVDPSLEPGQFDPYCDTALVDDLQQCSRLRLHGGGDWDAEVCVVEPDTALGAIRCGDSEWAEIRWSPGELAQVVWRARD